MASSPSAAPVVSRAPLDDGLGVCAVSGVDHAKIRRGGGRVDGDGRAVGGVVDRHPHQHAAGIGLADDVVLPEPVDDDELVGRRVGDLPHPQPLGDHPDRPGAAPAGRAVPSWWRSTAAGPG